MSGPKDKLGQTLSVGDTVVYGHDNGSSLEVSKIVKLTPQRAWMEKGVRGIYLACRPYDRVVKLEKV